jgi:hypothetical protein
MLQITIAQVTLLRGITIAQVTLLSGITIAHVTLLSGITKKTPFYAISI